jgi:hypothetical protein
MEVFIKDGRGNGRAAHVTNNQRLETISITNSASEYATQRGLGFNANTDQGAGFPAGITLTNATVTPVFYCKNTDSGAVSGVKKDLVITTFIVWMGTSTGGSGEAYIRIVRNPTGGTIITAPTGTFTPVNRDHRSSNTIDGTFAYGATGITRTGGDDSIIVGVPSTPSRTVIAVGELRLGFGNSVAVEIQAPGSNTSMDCYVAAVCYVQDFEN